MPTNFVDMLGEEIDFNRITLRGQPVAFLPKLIWGEIVLYQIWNAKGMQFIGMIGSGEAQI